MDRSPLFDRRASAAGSPSRYSPSRHSPHYGLLARSDFQIGAGRSAAPLLGSPERPRSAHPSLSPSSLLRGRSSLGVRSLHEPDVGPWSAHETFRRELNRQYAIPSSLHLKPYTTPYSSVALPRPSADRSRPAARSNYSRLYALSSQLGRDLSFLTRPVRSHPRRASPYGFSHPGYYRWLYDLHGPPSRPLSEAFGPPSRPLSEASGPPRRSPSVPLASVGTQTSVQLPGGPYEAEESSEEWEEPREEVQYRVSCHPAEEEKKEEAKERGERPREEEEKESALKGSHDEASESPESPPQERESSSPSYQSPQAKRESPQTKRESPRAKQPSPPPSYDSPQQTRTSPQQKRESPPPRVASPEPPIPRESTPPPQEAMEVEPSSPMVEKEPPVSSTARLVSTDSHAFYNGSEDSMEEDFNVEEDETRVREASPAVSSPWNGPEKAEVEPSGPASASEEREEEEEEEEILLISPPVDETIPSQALARGEEPSDKEEEKEEIALSTESPRESSPAPPAASERSPAAVPIEEENEEEEESLVLESSSSSSVEEEEEGISVASRAPALASAPLGAPDTHGDEEDSLGFFHSENSMDDSLPPSEALIGGDSDSDSALEAKITIDSGSEEEEKKVETVEANVITPPDVNETDSLGFLDSSASSSEEEMKTSTPKAAATVAAELKEEEEEDTTTFLVEEEEEEEEEREKESPPQPAQTEEAISSDSTPVEMQVGSDGELSPEPIAASQSGVQSSATLPAISGVASRVDDDELDFLSSTGDEVTAGEKSSMETTAQAPPPPPPPPASGERPSAADDDMDFLGESDDFVSDRPAGRGSTELSGPPTAAVPVVASVKSAEHEFSDDGLDFEGSESASPPPQPKLVPVAAAPVVEDEIEEDLAGEFDESSDGHADATEEDQTISLIQRAPLPRSEAAEEEGPKAEPAAPKPALSESSLLFSDSFSSSHGGLDLSSSHQSGRGRMTLPPIGSSKIGGGKPAEPLLSAPHRPVGGEEESVGRSLEEDDFEDEFVPPPAAAPRRVAASLISGFPDPIDVRGGEVFSEEDSSLSEGGEGALLVLDDSVSMGVDGDGDGDSMDVVSLIRRSDKTPPATVPSAAPVASPPPVESGSIEEDFVDDSSEVASAAVVSSAAVASTPALASRPVERSSPSFRDISGIDMGEAWNRTLNEPSTIVLEPSNVVNEQSSLDFLDEV